jgi:hypothetical protein
MKEKLNNLKERISENKKKSIGIAVLIVILVILMATGVIGNGAGNQQASLAESDLVQDLLNEIENQNKQESFDGLDTELEKEPKVQNILDPEIIDGLAYFSTVRVPVLADPDLFDYQGEKTNVCNEEIVWVTADIEPTRAPLTASVEKLLNLEKDFGFEPANFLATQKDLSLNEIIIEDSIAKIYLDGEFTIVEDCDLSSIFNQLEKVSLQYTSVSGVQIYLNDELLR